MLRGGALGQRQKLGAAHAIEHGGLGQGVGGQLHGLGAGIPEVVGEHEAGVLQLHAQLLGLHLPVEGGDAGLHGVDGRLVAEACAAADGAEAGFGQVHALLNQAGLLVGVVPVPVVLGRLQPHLVYLLHAVGLGGGEHDAGLTQGAAAGVDEQARAQRHGEAHAGQPVLRGAVLGVDVGAHLAVVHGLQVDAAGPEGHFQLVGPLVIIVGIGELLAVEARAELGVEAAAGLHDLRAGIVAEQRRLLHHRVVGEDQVGQVLQRENARRIERRLVGGQLAGRGEQRGLERGLVLGPQRTGQQQAQAQY